LARTIAIFRPNPAVRGKPGTLPWWRQLVATRRTTVIRALAEYLDISGRSILPSTVITRLLHSHISSLSARSRLATLYIMADQKLLSTQQISTHNSPDDCWLVVDKQVWDVTDFLEEHPGGSTSMNTPPSQLQLAVSKLTYCRDSHPQVRRQ
jgi:cytochrome b involved in lipid metabolism